MSCAKSHYVGEDKINAEFIPGNKWIHIQKRTGKSEVSKVLMNYGVKFPKGEKHKSAY